MIMYNAMLSFNLFNNHLASAKENYTGIMLLAYINCKMFKILKVLYKFNVLNIFYLVLLARKMFFNILLSSKKKSLHFLKLYILNT